MFLLHGIAAWAQFPSFALPGLRAAAKIKLQAEQLDVPEPRCSSSSVPGTQMLRVLPKRARWAHPCPDSLPGPRLHPQHPTGMGRVQAAQHHWCARPWCSQERESRSSVPHISPQCFFSSGNDVNRCKEYNKRRTGRAGKQAGQRDRTLGFPKPCHIAQSQTQSPLPPSNRFQAGLQWGKDQALEETHAKPAFCWCSEQPAGHLNMNFTLGFKLTDSKPQVLRVDRNFKNIIPLSGKLQQFPHSCLCLLELPPPKQPHPEMAAIPGSVLPQHSSCFEEADCKLYSPFLFFIFFPFFPKCTIWLETKRHLFPRNAKHWVML